MSTQLSGGYRAFAAFLVVSAVSLSSSAAPLQLPTWPQRFDIGGPEAASFGFMVTQPGPVTIDIQTNGAPVVATLQGAAPRAAEQGGTGTLHLAYQVTPQNLQVSALWTVRIVLVPPAAAAGARAGGSIVVHAPPVNPAAAQALLDKANAQAQSSRQAVAQRRPDPQAAAAQAAQMDAVLNGRRAQYDQQRQQVRAQLHAQLQPLAAAAQMRLANRVGTRGLAQESPARMTAAPPGIRAAKAPTAPGTGTSPQPPVGGVSGPAPQTAANPVITSVSVAHGQPGDPVVITGSGFGTGGTVLFTLNPGKDVEAHVDIWSDTQVFVDVPDASDILGFNGGVYVVQAQGIRSNTLPFQFIPSTEFRDLRATWDVVLQSPYVTSVIPSQEVRENDNVFAGFQGNDVLFASTILKNGWVVEDASVFCFSSSPCTGGAYPLSVPRGSPVAATTVHWWIDAASLDSYPNYFTYTFAVRIAGPKGVPDGVARP